jgi:hypothetical protein
MQSTPAFANSALIFRSTCAGLAQRIALGKSFPVICAAGLRAIVCAGFPSDFAPSRARK